MEMGIIAEEMIRWMEVICEEYCECEIRSIETVDGSNGIVSEDVEAALVRLEMEEDGNGLGFHCDKSGVVT